MSSILVVEQEGRYIERIHDALTSEGWRVKVVNDRDGALRAAAADGPSLLLVSAEVAGARELLGEFSRRRGGPGTVALVSESQASAATATDLGSDDLLAKPFTDQDLRLMVRRCLNAASRQASEAHAAKTRRLTAQEIFGDVLAEVEAEAAPAAPAPPRAPSASPPRAAAAAGALDRQLEATLSGLRESAREARPKPAARKAPGGAGVDDLLKDTLTGLELGGRAKTPAPRPGASGPKTATGATPPPRRSGEIDLGQLDQLVKPSSRPAKRDSGAAARAADEAFRTQRLETLRPVPPSAPREFGQYTLLDRVAVGGMAEVWKARMKGVEGFQKTVAIKKILSHLTDSVDFVTMFIDEAKLAAQLTHDNIIHIYDLGKIGEDYYIAMEYVDGKDLRSILSAARVEGKPLPPALALFIAARLASALDHAHRKRDFENRELGLVHRDVSPQNVLVGYEGEIKLCDFGIVKAVSKASKTQMGALKGKLQYMSPEQAWGKPVDARSDIFSLGAILFEMLTGRRLFAGDSEISVLEAVREGRIDRPRDVAPGVDPEIDTLVVRALAKDPDERFQSAGEMQRELERLLSAQRPAPTPADLAAYLRALFGDQARAAAIAPAAVSAVAAAAAATVPAARQPAEAAPEAVEVEAVAPAFGASLEAAEDEGKSKRLLIAAIAAAIVLGIALWLVFGRGRTAEPAGQQSAPATSAEPAPAAETIPAPAMAEPPAAVPAATAGGVPPAPMAGVVANAPPAPAPAADVKSRVDQEVARREAEMRQKLEADRRQLEEQVKRARAEAAAAPAVAPPPAETAPPPPAEVPPPVETAPPAPAPSEPAPSPSELPSAAASESPPPAASEPPPSAVEAAPPVQEPAPPPAPATEPAPPPAAAPAAPQPTVTVGQLVSGGPGVRPPVLVTAPKPAYPPIAQRMRVEGVVTVEVLVDEDGAVRDSRLVKRVTQDVGLNEAALAAARKARFKPATKEGVRVRMWYTLTFPFQL